MAATPPVCEFGLHAIDATLPGTDGREHTIFEHAGPNGLVVVFMCNHCPYVKAVIARIVRDAMDLAEEGVGFVAISSNDAQAYPQDDFENMKRFAQENGLPFVYLYDESQEVAKAYGAVCTPDFFGYNGKLELQYRGRLDASRKQSGPDELRRDLFEAMTMVARTGEGPIDQIPSVGCSIKWKDEA